MTEQERVVMPAYPKQAWLYHRHGIVDTFWLKFPEKHHIDLPPEVDFCITHRPMSPCICGVYTIHWMTEDDWPAP